MSIAALTEALDAFAANDAALLENIMAQFDRELAEIEAERSSINAALDFRRTKVADRKVAVSNEFQQRALDIMAIMNGKP
jgi:hypothetical protein